MQPVDPVCVDRVDSGPAVHGLAPAVGRVDHVVARAGAERVPSAAADEDVVAGAAGEQIVVGPAVQAIVARVAEEAVLARSAAEHVVARAAVEDVGARAAVEQVVAGAAEEAIIAGEALEDVIAGESPNGVTARRAAERVTVAGAVEVESALAAGRPVAPGVVAALVVTGRRRRAQVGAVPVVRADGRGRAAERGHAEGGDRAIGLGPSDVGRPGDAGQHWPVEDGVVAVRYHRLRVEGAWRRDPAAAVVSEAADMQIAVVPSGVHAAPHDADARALPVTDRSTAHHVPRGSVISGDVDRRGLLQGLPEDDRLVLEAGARIDIPLPSRPTTRVVHHAETRPPVVRPAARGLSPLEVVRGR